MPYRRPESSSALRLLEAAGIRLVPLDRTDGQSPFATDTQYATCPTCGTFASVFLTGGRVSSLCGHLGDPKRPLDTFGLLWALRAVA